MPRSKIKMQGRKRNLLPENFGSLEEFWAFWDTHSTADYEDFMEDVNVHVDIRSSKVYCAVAKDIIAQVRTQARRQGVSTETLINLWLQEKATEAGESKWDIIRPAHISSKDHEPSTTVIVYMYTSSGRNLIPFS